MTQTQLLLTILILLISIYLFSGEVGNVYFDENISKLETQGPSEKDTVKVMWQGVEFSNDWELKKHLLSKKQSSFLSLFPYIQVLPNILNLIVGCCSLCLFGYIVRLFLGRNIKRNNYKFFTTLVVAFLTGVAVFVLIKGLPELFIQKEINDYFPLALSLVAGLFLYKFYNLLSKKLPNVFSQ